MNSKSQLLPLLCCLIVTIIFSIHFVVAKSILNNHHPLALTTLRGLIGGVIVLAIYRKEITPKLKEHVGSLFLIGFLGFFLNQLLFMSGLKMTTALNASIITNAVPLVTAILATGFRLEKFSLIKSLGLLIGFGSVLFLILNSSQELSLNTAGDALIFGNMFVFALAIVLIKKLTTVGIHYGVISGMMMIIGGLLSSFVAGSDAVNLLHWGLGSSSSSLALIFEVLISTVLAYLLNFYALKHLEPSKITIFIYLQPMITALVNFYFDGVLPSMTSWGAFLGIVIGGLLVLKNQQKSAT